MIKVVAISSNPEFRLRFSQKFNISIENIKFVGLMQDIDEFSDNFCYKQKPNVIISTKSDDKKLKEDLKLSYIHISLYDDGTYPLSLINTQLQRICLNTIYIQKLDVYNLYITEFYTLIKLKFNPCICGTSYLLDCIIALKQNPYSPVTYKIIKNHAKDIAYKHGITISNMIDDMRESIEEMYSLTSSNFRKKVYGTNAYIDYPEIVKSICLL